MNYLKIYQQALRVILKDDTLFTQFHDLVEGKDAFTFDNYSLFIVPKKKNIFAPHVGRVRSGPEASRLLKSGELIPLLPTDTVEGVNKNLKGRVLKMPGGEEHPNLFREDFIKYFDKGFVIKAEKDNERSMFFIFEDDELVCCLAPIRRNR